MIFMKYKILFKAYQNSFCSIKHPFQNCIGCQLFSPELINKRGVIIFEPHYFRTYFGVYISIDLIVRIIFIYNVEMDDKFIREILKAKKFYNMIYIEFDLYKKALF